MSRMSASLANRTPGTCIEPAGSIHHSVSDLRVNGCEVISLSLGRRTSDVDHALRLPAPIMRMRNSQRSVRRPLWLDRDLMTVRIDQFAIRHRLQMMVHNLHLKGAEHRLTCGHLEDERIEPVDKEIVERRGIARDV